MDECQHIEEVTQAIAEGRSPVSEPELAEHLRECELCRAQLSRMNWLGLLLGQMRVRGLSPVGDHPEAMEVTAFVVHGYPGEQQLKVEAHVADCDECIHLVAAVRKRIDEAEDVLGASFDVAEPKRPGWQMKLRRAFSSYRRAAAFVSGLTVGLAYISVLALMVANLVALYVLDMGETTHIPTWLPPLLPPWHPVWSPVACVLLAILGRLAAGWLLRLATREPESTMGAEENGT